MFCVAILPTFAHKKKLSFPPTLGIFTKSAENSVWLPGFMRRTLRPGVDRLWLTVIEQPPHGVHRHLQD